MVQTLWGWSGDGDNNGDSWGRGQVLVPMQLSNTSNTGNRGIYGYGYIDGYALKSVDMDMDIEAKFHIHDKRDATCLSCLTQKASVAFNPSYC